jgi:hypothetical protein
MDVNRILRGAVVVLSVGAMLGGVAVMAGLLVPRTLPDRYRVILGAVIVLYGGYRLALTLTRPRRSDREERP